MLQGSTEKPRIKPTEGLLSTASERQDCEGETTKLVSKSGGPWFETETEKLCNLPKITQPV